MYQYSNSDAKKVKAWLVRGLSYRQISKKLSISEKILEEVYARELQVARAEARAIVGGTLFKNAMRGDLASLFFFLKTRGGWSEKRIHEADAAEPAEDDNTDPPTLLKNVHHGCNARNGCYKSGPKQRVAAFRDLHTKLIAEATRRNMPLDFERPAEVELAGMRGIYEWPHRKKDGSQDWIDPTGLPRIHVLL
jgi:hypothetical protein